MGWVKINSDGSAMDELGPIKAGGIFRDSNGCFLGGFSATFGNRFAFDAELAAVFMGIEIDYAKGWKQLWIESDSTYVIYILNATNPKVPWRFLEKWGWIKYYLNQMRWFATHIYREGNASADKLASFVSTDAFTWWDHAPHWLHKFLDNDRCNSFVRH